MIQSDRSRCWQLGVASYLVMSGVITLTGCFAIASFGDCAFAQITPDGTLPNNSRVTTQGNIRTIEGGTQAGGNLFHSFGEFSVPTGSEAHFNNAVNIQNIITRVTGGSVSNIDGIIRANGTANLFLINPSGIIFGSNASLNIGGSFLASTASSLKFADGTEFSATVPQTTPLLTISVPVGLQFGGNPGPILNQSQASPEGATNSFGLPVGLQVQPDKTLALLGGNVTLESSYLTATGGRIELGSVAGIGLVSLNSTDKGWALGYDGVQNFNNIQLSQQTLVDASGEGGGNIQVQGRAVTLKSNSGIFADTLGRQNGGGIFIRAEQLNIEDASGVSANTFSSGAGGNVSIKTGRLFVRDGAFVDARTFDRGQGGMLTVNASDSVELVGAIPNSRFPSGLFTRTEGVGSAGKLTIETKQLIVRDGAQVSAGTRNAGQGGTLEVTASESVKVIGTSVDGQIGSGLFTQSQGTGDAGDLTIKTGRLIVRDGAEVSSRTDIRGQGGTLEVTASESVEVIGMSMDGENSSGLYTQSQGGTGDAGDLTIKTGRLIVREGGVVSTVTFGEGSGGTLTINASDSVELIGTEPGGQFTRGLVTQSEGTGDAGDLIIMAGKLIVRDGARVSSATTGQGKSGDIRVNASNSVNLSGVGPFGFSSGLFTSTSSVGQGGNITVDTSAFQVANGAVLSAKTIAEGNGGNITVNANTFEAVDGGQVLTNTRSRGRTGNITLNATNSITLSGSDSTYADRLSKFGSNFINNEGAESGLFASNNSGASVKGGDIFVNARTLNVQDRARIAVNNQGTGQGGNIQIQAGNLTLKNQALISAETFSSQGGNIEIGLKDILLLRQGSRISTNAGIQGAGGDGGNIAINAPSGFIVAVPTENSDITANAFTGSGGRVQINAFGIFGMTARSREDLARLLGTNDPTQLDPRLLPTSDITAISQTNPSLNGQVTLNTLDVDPSRGLVNLPAVPVEAEVAQGCTAGGSQATSEFIVTGRGGLPPNPGEALSTDAVQVDLMTLNPEADKPSTPAISTNLTSSAPDQLVEAQGWVMDANGNVVLTANAPTVTPHSSWHRTADCQKLN